MLKKYFLKGPDGGPDEGPDGGPDGGPESGVQGLSTPDVFDHLVGMYLSLTVDFCWFRCGTCRDGDGHLP